MRKILLKNGYLAYECSADENTLIGGFGVCDDCCQFSPNGYLVPVLNHYMCPICFLYWMDSTKFYPEDVSFESRNAAYYESMIPFTSGTL